MKQRLDKELFRRGLVVSRSQAEDVVRRGFVSVDGLKVTKAGHMIEKTSSIKLDKKDVFVSRGGEKLNSVIDTFKINFKNKVALDVGSSTGGFTDVALRGGAKKVIAVDVGTNQMHSSLRGNPRLELHEKTDIRDFKTYEKIDIVLADVSFISLREILPHVAKLCTHETQIVVMVKPQFEAGSEVKHKGVIKNDSLRRKILKDFELWAQQYFAIEAKADSGVSGAKGNRERFYMLKKLR